MPLLLTLFPVRQRFDIAQAFDAFDPRLAHIADREVAVQCLADGNGVLPMLRLVRFSFSASSSLHHQLQFDIMRPAG